MVRFKKFKKLMIPPQWKEYWTAYPHGYTILEALVDWLSEFNGIVDNINDLNEYMEDFINQWQGEMREEVTQLLTEWKEQGVLEDILLAIYGKEVDNIKIDLSDRGVNLRSLGAKLDGVTDDYDVIMDALDRFNHVYIPVGTTLATSKTIVLKSGQSIIGGYYSGYPDLATSKIRYIGEYNPKTTVIQVGENGVGDEPTKHTSGVKLKNIVIDGSNKAGFGVYGSYLTNETEIDNVIVTGTNEYAFYMHKCWYAKFTNLLARINNGSGIAFGMPLVFTDGTEIKFTSDKPYDVNCCYIYNIRANSCGFRFINSPGTFDPYNRTHRLTSYGIGAGMGHGFILKNFLTEANGGIGLYIYSEGQHVRHIKEGYVENNCRNSGLDPETEMINMFIENRHPYGRGLIISDIFMELHSGGIGVIGERRPFKLQNVYLPQFIKDFEEGLDILDFKKYFTLENVYHGLALSDHNKRSAKWMIKKRVNLKESWTIEFPFPLEEHRVVVTARKLRANPGDFSGPAMKLTYSDGRTDNFDFRKDVLNTETYEVMFEASGDSISLSSAGNPTSSDFFIDFHIYCVPETY